jgi:hypothetical protein
MKLANGRRSVITRGLARDPRCSWGGLPDAVERSRACRDVRSGHIEPSRCRDLPQLRPLPKALAQSRACATVGQLSRRDLVQVVPPPRSCHALAPSRSPCLSHADSHTSRCLSTEDALAAQPQHQASMS